MKKKLILIALALLLCISATFIVAQAATSQTAYSYLEKLEPTMYEFEETTGYPLTEQYQVQYFSYMSSAYADPVVTFGLSGGASYETDVRNVPA